MNTRNEDGTDVEFHHGPRDAIVRSVLAAYPAEYLRDGLTIDIADDLVRHVAFEAQRLGYKWYGWDDDRHALWVYDYAFHHGLGQPE